ncbi:type III pantothenate kinase [Heliorestis acidaminivorans]|uniref:Type III pantothenate kinase n=1 Tax=Heliorestis acidaminivorans TaxID=553427 RepID=A0A6I0ET33_9FIRM|nr:type III pantothenate kinase [Heliorestis acidaminivorans]KAB2953088.1 type III pantothenate kinase [Heliorestis acidaminivorans]
MILAIDVGNSHILLGLFTLKPKAELLHHWKLSTDPSRTADEYAIQLRNLFRFAELDYRAVTGMVMSSVVPPLMPTLERMCQSYFRLKPLVIGPGVSTGMNIRMENPKEVGADRIVNAVSAYERYGGPLIVVDFGTAMTFCAISEEGDYLGGAIAPGLMISTEALFARASKLPRIELTKPAKVIGKNTVQGMQSGILYGFAGQIDGVVSEMKKELGEKTRVIATGETAELIAPETEHIDMVDPFLTLQGLRIIYQRTLQED